MNRKLHLVVDQPVEYVEALHEEVRNDFLLAWLQRFLSGSAESVANGYYPDATLMPTLDPDVILHTPEERLAYFNGLFQKGLREVVLSRPEEFSVRMLGAGVVKACGFCIFRFSDSRRDKPARFTLIGHKDPHCGTWMVLHHQSEDLSCKNKRKCLKKYVRKG